MERIKYIKYKSTQLFAEDSGKNIILYTNKKDKSFKITLPQAIENLEITIYCPEETSASSEFEITGGKNIPMIGSLLRMARYGTSRVVRPDDDKEVYSLKVKEQKGLDAGSWFKFLAFDKKWFLTGRVNIKGLGMEGTGAKFE